VVKLVQVIRSRGLCLHMLKQFCQSIMEVIFIISFIGGTFYLLFDDFSIHAHNILVV